MNSLKPILILAVLALIGYSVYCRVNVDPDELPEEVSEGWDVPVDVQLGTSDEAPTTRPDGTAVTADRSAADNSLSSTHDYALPTPPPSDISQQTRGRGYVSESSPPAAQSESIGYGRSDREMPSSNPPTDERTSWGNSQPEMAAPVDPHSFTGQLPQIQQDLNSGRLREGLLALSAFYFDASLTANEQRQLTELLDQVAGTVVYSTQHFLEPPYTVQTGERLEDIAQKLNISWRLLANINGISDPSTLQAGEQLKVIRGPFNAVLSIDKHELTLWVGGHYAGRFSVGFGQTWPAREGEFKVSKKILNPEFHGMGKTFKGDDPANPFGGYWITLEDQAKPTEPIGIQGTDERQYVGRNDLPGSITLGGRDISDVYGILSIGSRVTVRK